MSADEFRQVQLLAFEGEFVRWALPSDAVLSVVEERDWRGVNAADAAEVAGIAVSTDLVPVRVLLLAHSRGELPVKVRGPLELVAIPAADLLPLPLEFSRSRSLATQVAVQGGKPTLVVLDVRRLVEAVTHHLMSSAPAALSGVSR